MLVVLAATFPRRKCIAGTIGGTAEDEICGSSVVVASAVLQGKDPVILIDLQ